MGKGGLVLLPPLSFFFIFSEVSVFAEKQRDEQRNSRDSSVERKDRKQERNNHQDLTGRRERKKSQERRRDSRGATATDIKKGAKKRRKGRRRKKEERDFVSCVSSEE